MSAEGEKCTHEQMRRYLDLVEKFLPKLALFKNPARVTLVSEYKQQLEEWKATVLQGEDAPIPRSECFYGWL